MVPMTVTWPDPEGWPSPPGVPNVDVGAVSGIDHEVLNPPA